MASDLEQERHREFQEGALHFTLPVIEAVALEDGNDEADTIPTVHYHAGVATCNAPLSHSC